MFNWFGQSTSLESLLISGVSLLLSDAFFTVTGIVCFNSASSLSCPVTIRSYVPSLPYSTLLSSKRILVASLPSTWSFMLTNFFQLGSFTSSLIVTFSVACVSAPCATCCTGFVDCAIGTAVTLKSVAVAITLIGNDLISIQKNPFCIKNI